MWCLLMGTLTFITAACPTEESPRGQYEVLVKEYDTARAAFIDALNKAGTDEDRVKAESKRPSALALAPRFFALAEDDQDDIAAIDALTWIASHCMFVIEGEKALQILVGKYSGNERVAAYAGEAFRYGEPFAPYEAFLRAVLKNNPHRKAQASACVALAAYLKMAKGTSDSNLVRIALQGERSLRGESLAELNRLQEIGLDKVAAESETLFERAIEQYGDVRLETNYPQEAGKFAKEQLFELRHLSIGSKALEVEGKDISGKAMKLSDYRGRVVVLDFGSHRNCGVCRAMYPHLRPLVQRFEGRPIDLIGINTGDDLDELKHLVIEKEITWKVVWDGSAEEGPVTRQWVIRSMPTIYVLDHKGVIRNKGFLSPEEISGTVEMLLKAMMAEGS